MRVIPLLMPVDTEVVNEDTPMSERGRRAELSKTAMSVMDTLLEKHPEVNVAMMNLGTPRGPTDLGRKHDHIHSALASNEGTTIADLKDFIDTLIPSLLKLRIDLEDNPEVIDKLRRPQ